MRACYVFDIGGTRHNLHPSTRRFDAKKRDRNSNEAAPTNIYHLFSTKYIMVPKPRKLSNELTQRLHVAEAKIDEKMPEKTPMPLSIALRVPLVGSATFCQNVSTCMTITKLLRHERTNNRA